MTVFVVQNNISYRIEENKKAVVVGCNYGEIPNKMTFLDKTYWVKEIDNLSYGELDHARIPESVERIGDNAFVNCRKLTSLELPWKYRHLPHWMFDYCVWLENITFYCKKKKFENFTMQLYKSRPRIQSTAYNFPYTYVTRHLKYNEYCDYNVAEYQSNDCCYYCKLKHNHFAKQPLYVRCNGSEYINIVKMQFVNYKTWTRI